MRETESCTSDALPKKCCLFFLMGGVELRQRLSDESHCAHPPPSALEMLARRDHSSSCFLSFSVRAFSFQPLPSGGRRRKKKKTSPVLFEIDVAYSAIDFAIVVLCPH